MRPGRALAALAALLLVGASRAAVAIDIVAPASGSALTWMPVSIVIDFDASADTQTFSVLLNGNDITGSFSLAPIFGGRIRATAPNIWGGIVVLGGNQIDASIDVGGSNENAVSTFDAGGDPFADEVIAYTQGTNGGQNAGSLPGIALGSPVGGGMFIGGEDVVSLGRSGSIEVRFSDNVIVDGPGVDFTVFENAFLEIGAGSLTQPPFAEPGRVEVSQDGVEWFAFPCDLIEAAGPYWPGCAGVYPVFSDATLNTPHASIPTTVPIQDLVGVHILSLQNPGGSGGDSFDLADLDLDWVRHVRIEAAAFDPPVVGSGNSSFDFDAVAAVHSSPTIPPPVSLPAVSSALRLLLALLFVAAGGSRRTWP